MQLNTKFFDTWPWPKGTLSMEWRSLILCSPCTFLKHFKGQVACCTFLEDHWTCSGITSIVNLCSSGTSRECFPSGGKLSGTGALDVISWSAWTDSVEPLNGSERQKRVTGAPKPVFVTLSATEEKDISQSSQKHSSLVKQQASSQ